MFHHYVKNEVPAWQCITTASRPALGPTQPPIHRVMGDSYSGGKATGAWSWPLTSIYNRD